MLGPETTAFLQDLAANNNRDWFTRNRARHDSALKAPAKVFAERVADLLRQAHGQKVQPRIFRLHRDLRFAKDKTPYNAHLHIAFSNGATPFAWMFGLEPDRLVLGYGTFAFPGDRLAPFREAVHKNGAALTKALEGLRIDNPPLKRVPAPYPQNHPQATLLRHKGLTAWLDYTDPSACYGTKGPENTVKTLQTFTQLRKWLANLG